MQYVYHKPKQQMKSNKTLINSVRWFTLAYFLAEAFEVNFQTVYSFAGITSLASCQLQTMICKEQVNL